MNAKDAGRAVTSAGDGRKVALSLLGVWLAAGTLAVLWSYLGPSSGQDWRVADHAALETLLDARDLSLPAIRAGAPVPRVFLAAFPPDWATVPSTTERKRDFIRVLLPIVLRENERVREIRRRLKDGDATPGWRAMLAARYRVDDDSARSLLRRIDIVPPSLVIAQAAIESGWGRSRFAREGNALFGQWTWDANDPGMVPKSRAAGATHRIRRFDTLAGSVRAYMINLNRHAAYRGFREMRRSMRAASGPFDGTGLAGQLDAYSELGESYVESLQTVIRVNGLDAFDRARLAPSTGLRAAFGVD
ncbi:glucosaminidase domain-containing protein [Oceanibacterium hippocampi]|uniref:Mannosyl-glycoprotein endo-beta-N-acetylglucosamidase-like domain-containing protein n=1 Tax=Oceanibacterium hippocampi TaxID=745714 RepID=A0A1Y5RM32_9PROT|nr:glucosaminidase domain-containing protein [Oceanibacterium hippocampi]SLN19568.1 hypothetical protein OCH7691_00447 [Oceanibacterium hippocampi]